MPWTGYITKMAVTKKGLEEFQKTECKSFFSFPELCAISQQSVDGRKQGEMGGSTTG